MNYKALANHFRSIDSAPGKYSVSRPPSVANGFFISFITIALLSLTVLLVLNGQGWAPHRDVIFISSAGDLSRLPIRLFFLVFFATYALYVYTTWPRRAVLGLQLVGETLAIYVVVDIAAVTFSELGWFVMPLFAQQVISGLAAMAVFPHAILSQARLPQPSRQRISTKVPLKSYLKMFLVVVVAVAAAVAVGTFMLAEIEFLRSVALMGGLGPGVFLVVQLFCLAFLALGRRRNSRGREGSFNPAVAVLVPAHNEAHDIESTIESIEKAAATYDGAITVYVVDNCSIDETAEVARQALSRMKRISGQVFSCDIPGKATALNYGLAQIEEDFVVRIDADTVVGDGCFDIAMRHFLDERVGAVGGLPLPKGQTTLIEKVRLIEVLLRHGFFQVAQGGFDGIIGVPGMFAVYRRQAILEVGGTTEGMNGEDTDIVLRISAAGYKVISDPAARYYSETPESYAHLREQRLRWFRSIYHITGHNRNLLFRPSLVTGSVVLPYMLVSAARRAMLAPMVLYAVMVLVLFGGVFFQLAWAPILAMVIGISFMVAVIVCLAWRMPRAVLHVPLYLGFRLLRSYFTLASALTLIFPPLTRDKDGDGATLAPGHSEGTLAPIAANQDQELPGRPSPELLRTR